MGTRFLAVLAVVALGAGSAVVGLTMASGTWTVVGEGLAPGQGYALNLTAKADHVRLELANASAGASASFSVYGPGGARVGHYTLDEAMRTVEVTTGAGLWTVFVYSAHDADLSVAVHGATADEGRMLPAESERREVVLGQANEARLHRTYTAVLDAEPVLAGVYLQGSARGFASDLRTEKGVVETVQLAQVDGAAHGMVVAQQGSRTTSPGNLMAGSFHADVRADRISGTLVLAALYLKAPEFPPMKPAEPPAQPAPPPVAPTPPTAEKPREAPPPGPPAPEKPAPPEQPREKPPASPPPEEPRATCGDARADAPFGFTVSGASKLLLTLQGRVDPWVTVFGPDDRIVGVAQLAEPGSRATLDLAAAGDYVLFARGGTVHAELLGAATCELRLLATEAVTVAAWTQDEAASGNLSAVVNFTLDRAPLAFGLKLRGLTSIAYGLHAELTGPRGEAARVSHVLSAGAGQQLMLGGVGGKATAKATHMVAGAWTANLGAQMLQGTVEVTAVHYVRASA